MRIDKVTITGVDDNVDYKDLVSLQREFPFVEWGVLFSKSKEGQERYPSRNWVMGIPEVLNLSAHFCGWHARQVLEEQNFGLISLLPPNVKRVQLNYNFQQAGPPWNLFKLKEYMREIKNPSVILQYNKANHTTLDNFMQANILPTNIHFLYDSSGGRGKEIDRSVLAPPFVNYTGYSGGITPLNAEDIINNVLEVCKNIDHSCWFDMETGVRTNNKLDLLKVFDVLSIYKRYIVSRRD